MLDFIDIRISDQYIFLLNDLEKKILKIKELDGIAEDQEKVN